MKETIKEKIEKLRAALVANGMLTLEDSNRCRVRTDGAGNVRIEAAGVSEAAAEQFKAAMLAAGIPVNVKVIDHT